MTSAHKSSSSFESLARLLKELCSYRQFLHLKTAGASKNEAETTLGEFMNNVGSAEKHLKIYLYQLTKKPTGKRLTPDDVLAAFTAMRESWDAVAAPERAGLSLVYSPADFCSSLAALLQDESALHNARKDISIPLADLLEDML